MRLFKIFILAILGFISSFSCSESKTDREKIIAETNEKILRHLDDLRIHRLEAVRSRIKDNGNKPDDIKELQLYLRLLSLIENDSTNSFYKLLENTSPAWERRLLESEAMDTTWKHLSKSDTSLQTRQMVQFEKFFNIDNLTNILRSRLSYNCWGEMMEWTIVHKEGSTTVILWPQFGSYLDSEPQYRNVKITTEEKVYLPDEQLIGNKLILRFPQDTTKTTYLSFGLSFKGRNELNEEYNYDLGDYHILLKEF